jgi:Uma2 family endonuclease
MARLTAEEPRFTYGDYVQWTGDERWELYEGKAVLMSPGPAREHQELLMDLAVQVGSHLRDHACKVYVAPFDVRFPESDEPDAEVATVLQPDLLVVCDPAKLDDAGCRGAPDWVVEIASPSTVSRDRVIKRDLYEKHGVKEYWLVDPTDGAVLVYRLDSTKHRFDQGTVSQRPATTPVGVLPGLAIDWSRTLASRQAR